jgi:hypothetical protein
MANMGVKMLNWQGEKVKRRRKKKKKRNLDHVHRYHKIQTRALTIVAMKELIKREYGRKNRFANY